MNKRVLLLFLPLALTSCQTPMTGPYASSLFSSIGQFVEGEHVFEFEESEVPSKAWISNGYGNGGMFLSKWSKDRVSFVDGKGHLSLVDIDGVNYGSEIKLHEHYLFGYFGGRMKTFKRSGTVQSIFTYNGGPNYEWDEIDIEFLGKDTTEVQFNYYDDGNGNHGYVHKLGFDSSEDFHDYGFLWQPDRITWFVDFQPVYSVEAKLNQWGNFFVNVWAGNSSIYGWTGRYEPTSEPLTAIYEYLCYAPMKE